MSGWCGEGDREKIDDVDLRHDAALWGRPMELASRMVWGIIRPIGG